MMKVILSLLVVSAMFGGASLQGASCALCDKVRADNEAHPERNFEYYEDYLKNQESKKTDASNSKPAESNSAAKSAQPAGTKK